MSGGRGVAAGVLVTRPEPGLSETMRALASIGYAPVAAPLLRVQALSPPMPQAVQAVLLTSGQAAWPLAAAAPHLLATKMLAVGDRTAARARSAGFTDVRSAAGDATDLAALVRASCQARAMPLLLAGGAGQGSRLCVALRADGFRVIRRAVYATSPVSRLPAGAVTALRSGMLGAALFFSRETAAAFVRVLPRPLRPALATVRALAISASAAEPLRDLRWRAVEAALRPEAAALLSLL